MQTRFSAQQRSDPSLAEAERIIASCVRHGFCPQTCPTYVLLGDENDSPRGRIDLMRAMLENGGRPDAATVRHLDRCLGCLACETTCAARVDYRHLLDRARVYIDRHFTRPWRERLWRALVAAVLPSPTRLRLALRLGRAVRPLASLLPARAAQLVNMLPRTPQLAHAALPSTVQPARGDASKRVALVAGCVQQVMGAHINAAARRVLERHGCEVVEVAGDACCGALSLHLGREADGLARARALLTTLNDEVEGAGLDAVVIAISGCGTTLKDYAHLFAGDPRLRDAAAQVTALVRDVSELLAGLDCEFRSDLPALPLAYHDACSLQHGQRVTQAPRQLLKRAGFDVREVPERHFCCGSAGSFNLLEADIARRLGARKAAHIASTGACAVASGNLGCMVQLGHHAALPMVHTVELLDWASGGPLPAALSGVDMTAWPPRAATPTSAAQVPDDEALNYWVYEA